MTRNDTTAAGGMVQAPPALFPATPGRRTGQDIRPEQVRRLVVRAPNWIGDAVMAEPALTALRRLFPAAKLTLLVKPAIAELFRQHPAVTDVLVYEKDGRHAGFSGKWSLAADLRQRRFDLAVLFQNAFEAALLVTLAGVPRRYGYATDARGWLLTDPIARPTGRPKRHQVHYYYDLLRPLGVDGPPPAPRLYVSAEEEQLAEQMLRPLELQPADLLVGINPGSTYGGAKRWLPERFAESAERLIEQLRREGRRAHVVLVGARGEEALGAGIASRMASRPLVLSGRTSIRELMAVIRRCQLFLTNDTGPMHIAAAFGVPVVAIFGPTDFEETAPFGEQHRMVRQPVDCSPCLLRECPIDHRCMTGVTVEAVLQAVAGHLKGLQKEVPSCLAMEPGATRISRHAGGQAGSGDVPPRAATGGQLDGITVFLDRDGTLNVDHGYVRQAEQLELLPGAAEAVARLNAAGAQVVLVTNQSAIGRGLLDETGLAAIHRRLQTLLEPAGGRLDAIYFCPHHPDEGCGCRKPAVGLLHRAVSERQISLETAYVVGDQRRDVELARAVGARSVLVLSGPSSLEAYRALQVEAQPPDHVADNLPAAVEWILRDAPTRPLARRPAS